MASHHHLRGVSARSLDSTVKVVDDLSGDLGEVGGQLFAVVTLLDGSPSLRRVLTDPSTEEDARVQLARNVFGGKVADGTLDVLAAAVALRWSAGRDFTDALEIAGVVAEVAAAEAGDGVEALETQLFEVGQVVHSDPELRAVLNDRSASTEGKGVLLGRILEGKVSEPTLALARQAVAERTGSFDRVLTTFGEIIAERRDRAVALVRVAYALDDDERQRLAAALSAKFDRDVHLNIVVDPSIVGGVAVSVGPDVVDATMTTRLEAARRALAG